MNEESTRRYEAVMAGAGPIGFFAALRMTSGGVESVPKMNSQTALTPLIARLADSDRIPINPTKSE
jgi:hypothetical protein